MSEWGQHGVLTAFDRVLHRIGSDIVSGELSAGDVETVEAMTERLGASRSIVREATRVLVSLGMLSAVKRVGLRVREAEHWDLLDPFVIGWRLDGPDRRRQLDELRALRRAVEPEAAATAARAIAEGRETAGGHERLLRAADALVKAADGGEAAEFLDADQELHAAVLALSDNTLFLRLRAIVEAALREQALRERRDMSPDARAVELHVEVARAVAAGDAIAAAAAMRDIVDRTRPHA